MADLISVPHRSTAVDVIGAWRVQLLIRRQSPAMTKPADICTRYLSFDDAEFVSSGFEHRCLCTSFARYGMQ